LSRILLGEHREAQRYAPGFSKIYDGFDNPPAFDLYDCWIIMTKGACINVKGILHITSIAGEDEVLMSLLLIYQG